MTALQIESNKNSISRPGHTVWEGDDQGVTTVEVYYKKLRETFYDTVLQYHPLGYIPMRQLRNSKKPRDEICLYNAEKKHMLRLSQKITIKEVELSGSMTTSNIPEEQRKEVTAFSPESML